jgi:hypothetical protein
LGCIFDYFEDEKFVEFDFLAEMKFRKIGPSTTFLREAATPTASRETGRS